MWYLPNSDVCLCYGFNHNQDDYREPLIRRGKRRPRRRHVGHTVSRLHSRPTSSSMCCVVCFVLCTLLATVTGQFNVSVYSGRLSSECVGSYFRMFVTRRVPPRNYQYFHETLDPAWPDEDAFNTDVELRWRIVGGKRVTITEVPYTVLYGMYCGGTLIAPEWVITAAHCKDKETFILAGSTQRSLANRYPICAHFIHPGWNTSKEHSHDWDFQLVLLERPVPVTPSSRPIAIGNLEDIVPGEMVSVDGWGHMRYKDKMQDSLRRIFVPIMSHEECISLPKVNYRNITRRMFCAGFREGAKDSCQGDSGGPAVSRGKLVGLVSFGVGCAQRDQPGVYAAIPRAREWIREITALPL